MNHFTVYKITNLVNGKFYIGKHICNCKECVYMGSGKLIRAAIRKYGLENFKKEILFVFETEDEMNKKEAELVTEELIESGTSYNLCPGGQGGWGYINKNIMIGDRRNEHNIKYSPFMNNFDRDKYVDVYRQQAKALHNRGASCTTGFRGKTHTKEVRDKIGKSTSITQSGSKNSQFGTMWITNGTENKKIKKDLDTIPEGWYKGYNPKKHK